jgi:cytosine/adenosine deaminase-related metal-dependent hydrolase
LIRYHAAWVLPIGGPPIRDGWVAVEDGKIAAYGSETTRRSVRDADVRDVDLGDVVIMPGLVNAHTHLELSYLRDEVPPTSQFVPWIRNVMESRRRRSDPAAPEILRAVDLAVAEAARSGTAVVGDISNTLVTFDPLSRSRMAAVLFYELIRFNAVDPDAIVEEAWRRLDALGYSERVKVSLAAHAPYSVSPRLFEAIRRRLDDHDGLPCSVHLSESVEEVEFIRTAGGPWRRLLEDVGVWDPAWTPPGGSPVEFLDDVGFLDEQVLAVHGVQMTGSDLARLIERGTTLVTCPRSNGHTGAGAPPIEEFYASGVRVAVGTDSLASAPDLNVFAELATMRALAPSVPAASLLISATYEGARALGFDGEYGTIEHGKAAHLIAVDVTPGTDDVEEYLVSGIHPEQVQWIEGER